MLVKSREMTGTVTGRSQTLAGGEEGLRRQKLAPLIQRGGGVRDNDDRKQNKVHWP